MPSIKLKCLDTLVMDYILRLSIFGPPIVLKLKCFPVTGRTSVLTTPSVNTQNKLSATRQPSQYFLNCYIPHISLFMGTYLIKIFHTYVLVFILTIMTLRPPSFLTWITTKNSQLLPPNPHLFSTLKSNEMTLYPYFRCASPVPLRYKFPNIKRPFVISSLLISPAL